MLVHVLMALLRQRHLPTPLAPSFFLFLLTVDTTLKRRDGSCFFAYTISTLGFTPFLTCSPLTPSNCCAFFLLL